MNDYKCPYCTKQVLDGQNSICCDICDQWYHLQCCSNLTKREFLDLVSEMDSVWFCVSCIIDILPFSNISNIQFKKLFPNSNIFETKCEKIRVHKLYSNNCGVCKRTVKNKVTSIPCESCLTLIHKKCSNLNNTLNSKYILPYFCSSCLLNNLPFMNISETELNNLNNNKITQTKIYTRNSMKSKYKEKNISIYIRTLC